jgi:hypothetical protein
MAVLPHWDAATRSGVLNRGVALFRGRVSITALDSNNTSSHNYTRLTRSLKCRTIGITSHITVEEVTASPRSYSELVDCDLLAYDIEQSRRWPPTFRRNV